ncbi:MAG: hypothetical protein MZU84_08510 [Sphingobacterium sp.]|nr:hypothetical protein [Sphingobacterium sp.]
MRPRLRRVRGLHRHPGRRPGRARSDGQEMGRAVRRHGDGPRRLHLRRLFVGKADQHGPRRDLRDPALRVQARGRHLRPLRRLRLRDPAAVLRLRARPQREAGSDPQRAGQVAPARARPRPTGESVHEEATPGPRAAGRRRREGLAVSPSGHPHDGRPSGRGPPAAPQDARLGLRYQPLRHRVDEVRPGLRRIRSRPHGAPHRLRGRRPRGRPGGARPHGGDHLAVRGGQGGHDRGRRRARRADRIPEALSA